MLSVHNILARHTSMRCSAKRMHACTKADRAGGLPEVPQGLAVTSSLALLPCLRQQRQTRDKAVTTSLRPTPAYAQWLSVDGIGTMVAPAWLQGLAPLEWYERYGKRIEDSRLPRAKAAREAMETPWSSRTVKDKS